MPNLLLKNKKWLSSTLTKAFMKFLNSKLVILLSSFWQWLGCFSPAFLIDNSTFLNLSLGIFCQLSHFWVSNLRMREICSVSRRRKPERADSGTPYFYSLGYRLRCMWEISLSTAELKGYTNSMKSLYCQLLSPGMNSITFLSYYSSMTSLFSSKNCWMCSFLMTELPLAMYLKRGRGLKRGWEVKTSLMHCWTC